MDGRSNWIAVVTAVVDGPWGPTRIAAAAAGIVAVEMLAPPEAFAARLARRGYGSPVALEPSAAGPAADLARLARDRIGALLAGEPVTLDDLPVMLADRPAWDRLVLDAVRAIPRGSVIAYGELARRIGRGGAARAVGGAVGRNPIGLVIPCHRVIAADGTLGGYGVAAWGGREAALDLKQQLLALEGVHIPR